MKVLFLDIDGVLNSNGYFKQVGLNREPYPLGHLDPKAIAHLNRVVSTTGCKVVISSTWRRSNEPAAIAKYLTQKGFKHAESIISKTPVLDSPITDSKLVKAVERGVEIAAWLSLNKVERFAIVDDDADMAHLKKHLVKTDFMDGLTSEKADEIINRLTPPAKNEG